MKKKNIILTLFSIIVIGSILIIKLNAESIFHKSLSTAQEIMTEKMDTNESVYLKSSKLDILFAQDENDKIVLFFPSTYSIEKAQRTLSLIDESVKTSNKTDMFWILTNDKKDSTDRSFSSNTFTNDINIPGLVFKSEINEEQAFLFNFNSNRQISNVLWAVDFNSKSIAKYFNK